MLFYILLQAGRGIGKTYGYQDPAEVVVIQKIIFGIIAAVVIIGAMAYFMSQNNPKNK